MVTTIRKKMRKSTVHISYETWDDYSLATLAGRTLSAMTDNPHFADPRPAIADYTALVEDYRNKHEIASKRGSQEQREAKDNARKSLLSAMKEMAFYVNITSDGNREMLASSGFVIVPEPKSLGYPGVVKNMRLVDGRISGEVRLLFASIRNASEYEYCYATSLDESGSPQWGELLRTTNSRMNYIGGLEPGTVVYTRVRARNRKGIGDWNDSVSLIVR